MAVAYINIVTEGLRIHVGCVESAVVDPNIRPCTRVQQSLEGKVLEHNDGFILALLTSLGCHLVETSLLTLLMDSFYAIEAVEQHEFPNADDSVNNKEENHSIRQVVQALVREVVPQR